MNQEQVLGAVRSVLAALGGWAIGRGWLTADQITLIGGVVAALVPLIWTLFAHKQANVVAAALKAEPATIVAKVAAMPEVSEVKTTNTAAGRDLAAMVGSTPQAVVTVGVDGKP